MGKYDESKCLRSIAKVCKVDWGRKRIVVSKGTIIGIKRLGMLDYLAHYCGYVVVFTNVENIYTNEQTNNDSYNENKKELRKESRKRAPKVNNNNTKPNKTLKAKRNERPKAKV